jgi:hypothetical protein
VDRARRRRCHHEAGQRYKQLQPRITINEEPTCKPTLTEILINYFIVRSCTAAGQQQGRLDEPTRAGGGGGGGECRTANKVAAGILFFSHNKLAILSILLVFLIVLFQRMNSIFLSQQISERYFSTCLFSEAKKAIWMVCLKFDQGCV